MNEGLVRKVILGAALVITAFMLNYTEVQAWWCCMYPEACFKTAANAVVDQNGRREKDEMTEDDYEQMTVTSNFKVKWYIGEVLK